ncbi:MAG: efflux RND transporter periplasmic adaptor subunit [Roseburia sp.]|nr:efflux RND transporter periplasmic adaptor subunit [Roseburia sp.]MCM1431020.1 efflux RND transporter periplasmic adaptor subunit [Muribaculaceae bacterium]
MRTYKLTVFTGILAIVLGGCGRQEAVSLHVEKRAYERMAYDTAVAQTGDLNPRLSLTLRGDAYDIIRYDSQNPDLILKKVHVAVGDTVKKGDTLVTFDSEGISGRMQEYQESIEENQLLIDHYSRLMDIDSGNDYREDIANLQEDVRVAQLYVEELSGQLESLQLVASADGTITDMSDSLQNGVYVPGSALIEETSGSGTFRTERPGNYTFTKGEVYQAKDGALTCELKVKKVTKKQVLFVPVGENKLSLPALTLELALPTLKNVVYVDAGCLHETESGDCFVYVLSERGYRRAVYVTPGTRVDNFVVIAKGLQGGEEVCL